MNNKLAIILAFAGLVISGWASAQSSAAVQVKRASWSSSAEYEGQVEAVTDTRVAAQVAGSIKQVHVRAGDRVTAGQLLIEIDASQARQQQAAAQAQADAARAQLHALTQELARQKKLFEQNYISQGALERIEAEQRATAAQLKAHQAQVQAAQVQTDFFEIRAPYAGVVIDVPAMQGDMAMPGMPLLSLFEPAQLRVGVSVPVNALPAQSLSLEQVKVKRGQEVLAVNNLQRLPTADASSQSVRLRLTLSNGNTGLVPGQSVKVQLQRPQVAQQSKLFIPAKAVVRRAELTAVYVKSAQEGKPLLRQVRLGAQAGDEIEVLSGLSEGEWVYLDLHVLSKE